MIALTHRDEAIGHSYNCKDRGLYPEKGELLSDEGERASERSYVLRVNRSIVSEI